MDDKTLAANAAKGDQEAFATLVVAHRSYVYRIAYRIVLHEEDALDVTQNVFERLVRKIGDFNGDGSFRSWLATIAAREAIDHHRRPSRRERPTEPLALEVLADRRREDGDDDPRDRINGAQRRSLVEGAMRGLSPQQRAIFALRLAEGMGPKEIAERLGIPARQVRSQLARAMARIREAVAEET